MQLPWHQDQMFSEDGFACAAVCTDTHKKGNSIIESEFDESRPHRKRQCLLIYVVTKYLPATSKSTHI